MSYQNGVVEFSTAVAEYLSSDSDVINVDTLGSGVQLDWPLEASVVEEIHLEMLHYVALIHARSTWK